jgi:hypothetical protein
MTISMPLSREEKRESTGEMAAGWERAQMETEGYFGRVREGNDNLCL